MESKGEGGYAMNFVKEFIYEEDGLGVVEIILIIVVIIGLIIIFKTSLTSLIQNIFKTITERSNEV